QPTAGLVRGWPSARAELGVLAARVERVAAELDGAHLERDAARLVGAGAAALADEIEDLRRRAGRQLPRLLEDGRLEALSARARGEERAPEPQRERACAAFERVERGGPVADRPFAERDAARLLEGRRE